MKNVNKCDIEKAKKQLESFIKANNMRCTHERFFILEQIYLSDTIYSAAELYECVKSKFHVSMSTIYNVLETLVKANLVVKHTFNTKAVKYQRVSEGKNYFYKICLNCDGVKYFSDKKLSKSISLRSSNSFKALNHSLYIYGLCKKCMANMKNTH